MADSQQTSWWGSISNELGSFGSGLLDDVGDFASGTADWVQQWGLPDLLDLDPTYTGTAQQQYAGRYPPVDSVGYDPAAYGNSNGSGMSQEAMLLIAGAIGVVALVYLVK